MREQCFKDYEKRRAGEVEASISALRSNGATIVDGLYAATYAMLRHGGECRDAVVAWMARYCDVNRGRGKMQIRELECGSHGGATNLSSVALPTRAKRGSAAVVALPLPDGTGAAVDVEIEVAVPTASASGFSFGVRVFASRQAAIEKLAVMA